ncbi:hypothetical protein CWATWH8502_729 [Crocosphaera watsonii WH 8502]|uniref:Uncharacterized protein n=5 Tax=Crocosphaera watsonii TaxID=263511 RepID=T2JL52_CROWT|nr:hypothetical protein CWATWH0003_1731 [Crocosphaera watsonii WH 0003]CCQ49429.1 hypothetical protein CWATWH8502_729 [Crocosphaera watsonii WH 8502]CCQ54575.1 hypothetical protein CWATWH0005_2387 [Crocosphaera watsonii WH 0005]CCQ59735.1 hypothetical protein CWATWH0401_302 [Crocosphaera watsonii WH 0401]CCQ65779.1 hypothetical protein CWATWH0402_2386 [Crocosphaera watsonii WH 0402]
MSSGTLSKTLKQLDIDIIEQNIYQLELKCTVESTTKMMS